MTASRRDWLIRLVVLVGIGVLFGVGFALAKQLVDDGPSTSPRQLNQCTYIGYQDGIQAFMNWYRQQPGVPKRGARYDPNNITTWPWVDKLERTMRIWKDDHDAECPPAQPPPPTTAPPVTTTAPPVTTTAPPITTTEPEPTGPLAPRTYNKVLPNGSDAKFCTDGIPRSPDGRWRDGVGVYDEKGLDTSGRRTPDTQVPGLRLANNTNGLEPCDGYTEKGVTFPPWPAGSYEP